MNTKEKYIIKKLFSQYYKNQKIVVPSKFSRREFGIVPIETETMIRHLAFDSVQSFSEYISKNIPLHLYYSSAYYEHPSIRNMNEKGWLGAELIFDIDADHIDTPCKKKHDLWVCNACGFSGKGAAPEKCPKCGSKDIKEKKWLCEKCLNVSKEETFKLIDEFLIPDFGFSKNELQIVFSGQRGYHVHVLNEQVHILDQFGRREIANYVMGQGFTPEYHGFIKNRQGLVGPTLNGIGWRGKGVKALVAFLEKLEGINQLTHIQGISTTIAKKILENKELILTSLLSPSSETVHLSVIKNLKSQVLYNILVEAVKEFGCKIDAPVTGDIKRLIRMPGSLHGKTGFMVKSLSYNDLEKFNPFKDAIVFKRGTLLITLVDDTQEIRINNELYGPFKEGERVDVPTAVAVFLILQKKATIGSEDNV